MNSNIHSKLRMNIKVDWYNWCVVMIIFLLSGLVGPWVFQSVVKLAKIFEWKCKSNWKVQASTPWTIRGRPNVNKIDSCLVTCFDWRNENTVNIWGTRMWWRNKLARWHPSNDILNLDIKISEFWKSCQLSVGAVRRWRSENSVGLVGVSLCLFVDPYRLSLSSLCYSMQAEHRTINDCSLFTDWFLYLSCLHLGNIVLMD